MGLWVGERIVAVSVSDELGAAILAEAPTPTLAHIDRDGLYLLAVRDQSVAEVDVPGLRIMSRPYMFRLPTGHPGDPYLWRLPPEVGLMPLSGILTAERTLRTREPE